MYALVLAAALAQGQATPILTPAEVIVARMVAAVAANEEAKRRSITYEKTRRMDDVVTSQVKSSQTFAVYAKNGRMVERLIAKDGKVVAHGKEEPDDPFLDELIGLRYTFTLAQPDLETVDGHLYYVLAFAPTGKLKGKSDREKITNALSGTAWVDAETFAIHRLVGHVGPEAGISVGFWGLGTLAQFDITFLQEERDGLIVNAGTVYTVKATSLVEDRYERETTTFENFRAVEPARP